MLGRLALGAVETVELDPSRVELVDKPFTQSLRLDIIAEAIGAILKWEPRIEVAEVKLASHSPGEVVLDLAGVYLPEGREIFVEGVLVA